MCWRRRFFFGDAANGLNTYAALSFGGLERAVFLRISPSKGQPVSIRNFDNWIGMLLGQQPENCALSGRCECYSLIEADGSVYPCDFYVLNAWKMGNIGETSFLRLARSPVAEQFRMDSWQRPEACGHCKWLSLCRGGCKRDRAPERNGCPSANRLCEWHNMFFEARRAACPNGK